MTVRMICCAMCCPNVRPSLFQSRTNRAGHIGAITALYVTVQHV